MTPVTDRIDKLRGIANSFSKFGSGQMRNMRALRRMTETGDSEMIIPSKMVKNRKLGQYP
jgi:hypothetical protein